MKTHRPADLQWNDERRKQFLDFVQRVSPEADPVSVMLFGQILHVNNLLVQAAERNLGSAWLTWAKFRLMMNLQRCERYSATGSAQPSELSEMQGISRNTASALIASLEKEQMISRELHGTDRRRFLIRLTPEGRKMLKARMSGQFKFVTECFEMFSAHERHQLLDLLMRLNRTLAEKR